MKRFISVRVMKATDWNDAIDKIEDQWFDEGHPLCDAVMELTPLMEMVLTHQQNIHDKEQLYDNR